MSISIVEAVLAQILVDSLDFNIGVVVKESVSSPKGKWADGLGNIVAMDFKNATVLLSEAFIETLNETIT